ncbi:MAG: hypothetical protein ABF904_06635 [Ethanoligenens sp.]
MPNNANVAYDLSLFEPKPLDGQPAQDGNKEPRRRKKSAAPPRIRASIRPIQAVRWSAISVVCLVALGSIMVCNVQNTKLNDQVAVMQKKMSAAQAEEIRLNMQQQSRASLGNVENYAVNNLGMQKTTPYQIEYIHINNKDKVVVQKTQQGILSRLYNWILAYL